MENTLYYGDNLEILRRHVKDETVDLVYLDPPFKSDATYNVLFAEQDGTQAAAQIKAFDDTWQWDHAAAAAFHETVERGEQVSRALQSFQKLIGECGMLAYLSMMAPRLVELRRVMKPTAGIYLHCDPTASHYLKLLMDAVFSPAMFRNEIIWRRTGSNSAAKRFGPLHQTLLYYGKTERTAFYPVFTPYTAGYVKDYFSESDARGRYGSCGFDRTWYTDGRKRASVEELQPDGERTPLATGLIPLREIPYSDWRRPRTVSFPEPAR